MEYKWDVNVKDYLDKWGFLRGNVEWVMKFYLVLVRIKFYLEEGSMLDFNLGNFRNYLNMDVVFKYWVFVDKFDF